MLAHLSTLVVLLRFGLVNALLRNVTVDDAATTGVIPHYLPSPSSWMQGADCPGCGAQPDPSLAFGGTWHDATFTPSDGSARAIELTFSGSALYVFFILANTIEFVDTVTDMSFIMDGVTVDHFLHNPTTSTEFDYNVPVFVNESLSSDQHQFRMEATGNHSTLILFDYLVYTSVEDETTSTISSLIQGASASTSDSVSPGSGTQKSSSKSNTGPIIGGAVAGALVLLLLSGALLYHWRDKKRARNSRGDRIITQEVKNDRVSLLPGSTEGTVGIVPFTSSSNGRIAISSPYATMPSAPKAPALHESAIPSATRLSPLTQGEPRKQNNFRNDSEAFGHSRAELSQTVTPPSLDPDTSVLPSDSPLPRTRRVDGRSADEARMLRSQVELLMDEVSRLRQQQREEVGSEDLPGYSEGRTSPDFIHRK